MRAWLGMSSSCPNLWERKSAAPGHRRTQPFILANCRSPCVPGPICAATAGSRWQEVRRLPGRARRRPCLLHWHNALCQSDHRREDDRVECERGSVPSPGYVLATSGNRPVPAVRECRTAPFTHPSVASVAIERSQEPASPSTTLQRQSSAVMKVGFARHALVERQSRYVMLAKANRRDTETVVTALIKHSHNLPQEL